MNPDERTFADRVSDAVASFGGSWRFIIAAVLLIWLWVAFNLAAPASWRFDPFPFILLNLFLSLVAAFQAPFILMSQRRAEKKSEQAHRRTLRGIRRLVKKDLELEEEILLLLKSQTKDIENEILAILKERAGTGDRTPTS